VPSGVPETGPAPTADAAPTVSVTAPLAGTPLSAGASADVLAGAGDDFGVKSVTAYLGGRALGTDGLAPYDVPFTVPAELAGTTQAIAVVATDSSGQTSADSVAVTIPSTAVPVTAPLIGRIGGLTGSAVKPAKGLALTIPTVGAATVKVLLGKTAICTDTAAPFTCSAKLKGSDVGARTLTVIATSSKGASASVSVAIRVAKFTGAKATLSSARRVSGGVKVIGKVTPPSGVTKVEGCKGARMTLAYGAGRRTVALTSSCSFVATVRGRGSVARATFGGTAALAGGAAATRRT
jgi:hypothetical protein